MGQARHRHLLAGAIRARRRIRSASLRAGATALLRPRSRRPAGARSPDPAAWTRADARHRGWGLPRCPDRPRGRRKTLARPTEGGPPRPGARRTGSAGRMGAARSEEHTSELQALMRTSYAVLCLKQKSRRKAVAHTAYIQILNRQ